MPSSRQSRLLFLVLVGLLFILPTSSSTTTASLRPKVHSTSLKAWRSGWDAPYGPEPALEDWSRFDDRTKAGHFRSCLTSQAEAFSTRLKHQPYKSPRLHEVQKAVNSLVKAHGVTVSVVVFWGRGRYVRLLWKYLERNLAVNHGVVGEVLALTNYRSTGRDTKVGQEVLDKAVAQYPSYVRAVPMCKRPYGCAYQEILTRSDRVYVKLDDDVLFVKDGAIEHLVYQQLSNTAQYNFFSASIVNNPHGYGVHDFVGAMPRETYHWTDTTLSPTPPWSSNYTAVDKYYGKNVYPAVGSRGHEAFILNAAAGRLDAYAFDLWNMNQCRCGFPQPGLDACSDDGFYRWSIGAMVFTRNVSASYHQPVPSFDEPAVSMKWPSAAAPHRVGIVGEALVVHGMFSRQRKAKPTFGVEDKVLVPWYRALADQYTSQPYGEWKGNATLVELYERLSYVHGHDRFATKRHTSRPELMDSFWEFPLP